MRNVFDQYGQPENRLTHALATCLHEDRAFLGEFLDAACNVLSSRQGSLSGFRLREGRELRLRPSRASRPLGA